MIRQVTSSSALGVATLLAVACGGGTPEAKSSRDAPAPVTVASCAEHAVAVKKLCSGSEGAMPPEVKEEATSLCNAASEEKFLDKADACFVAAAAQKTSDACQASLKPCLQAAAPKTQAAPKAADAPRAGRTVASCTENAVAAYQACGLRTSLEEMQRDSADLCKGFSEIGNLDKAEACYVAARGMTRDACAAYLTPCVRATYP